MLRGVGDAAFGEQFGKHADGRERRFQFVRDVADEIGFLPRELQFGVQTADDEPASDADGQHQHGDEQAEREPGRVRGLSELCGIDEIRGDLPMRQRIADFRGDERAFPIRLKFFPRKHDGFGVVVEQRDTNLIAQFRVGLHEFAQAIHYA